MKELDDFKKKMRIAVSKYIRTEGCSCCQDIDGHKEATKEMAKLLSVPKYSDGSGYDFYRYTDKKEKEPTNG